MLKLRDPDLLRSALFIDGAWVGNDADTRIEVRNPATNQVVGTVPNAGQEETRRAIAAAQRAVLLAEFQICNLDEAAHSPESSAACSSAVCVAFSCLSGG